MNQTVEAAKQLIERERQERVAALEQKFQAFLKENKAVLTFVGLLYSSDGKFVPQITLTLTE